MARDKQNQNNESKWEHEEQDLEVDPNINVLAQFSESREAPRIHDDKPRGSTCP